MIPPTDSESRDHAQRRRRSALRHPALVEPADLADDATGRVEISTVEVGTAQAVVAQVDGRGAAGARAVTLLASAEGVAARVALAAVLIGSLVLGLLLTP